jgi:hypothetical protein
MMGTNLDYKNFLNSKFPGLKPTDNLLSLIITLASNMPNSTIAVKAANENAELIITETELLQLYRFFSRGFDEEVIDMKNGFVYFMSNLSEDALSYDDVDQKCAIYMEQAIGKAYYTPGYNVIFFYDQQIRDFLNLFKLSKLVFLS